VLLAGHYPWEQVVGGAPLAAFRDRHRDVLVLLVSCK
jgi:hypothetical protein